MAEKPRFRVRERTRTAKARSSSMISTTAEFKARTDGQPLLAKKKASLEKFKDMRGIDNSTKLNALTDGDGMIEMPDVPPKPAPGQSKAEWEEQKVAQCEKLMLQGIREPSMLQHYLDLKDKEHTARIIARVHARWEAVGSINNTKQDRGEMLGHLELLQSHLWMEYRKEGVKLNEKCYLATLLMRLLDQRMTLYGLTENTIQQVLIMTEDSEVMEKIKKQRKMADLAARLADKIAYRRQQITDAIDVDVETR